MFQILVTDYIILKALVALALGRDLLFTTHPKQLSA